MGQAKTAAVDIFKIPKGGIHIANVHYYPKKAV
jgi:hypothetical protein